MCKLEARTTDVSDLSGMAVVAATDSDSLILQQALHSTSGLPVELDVCDLALLVDQSEGVHSKALHVAVVEGDAHVILQEGELHPQGNVNSLPN